MSKIEKKYSSNNILLFFGFIALALFVGLFSPLNPFWGNGISITDSSVFRYIGMMMTKGQIPYVDMFDHKGLLLYWINFLGYLIHPQYGIWLVEIIFNTVTFAFLYKTVKLSCHSSLCSFFSIIPLAVTFSAFFEGGNIVEEYAATFIAVSLFIFEKYFILNEYSKIGISISGICLMCVLFLRVNMISLWAVYIIAVIISQISSKKFADLGKMIVYFTIGAVIAALPFIAYLIKTGALSAFIEDYFIFNFKYCDAGSPSRKILALIYFTVNPIISLFAILCVPLFLKGNKNEKKHVLTAFFYIMVTIISIAISGRRYAHYALLLIPAITPVIGIVSEKAISIINNNRKAVVCFITVIAVSVYANPYCFSFYREKVTYLRNNNSHNEAKAISDIIADNTDPEEKISVLGNLDIIYLISGHASATKYSFVPLSNGEISDFCKEEYYSEIISNKPKIILTACSPSPELNEILNSSYNNIGTTYLHGTVIEVYKLS